MNLIYMLAPLFIIAEIYGYFNRGRVYKRVDVSEYNLKSKIIMDIIFFLVMFISSIWIFLGAVLTPFPYLFIIYLLTRIIRLILVRVGNIRLLTVYTWVKLMIDIVVLGTIFTKLF